MPGEPGIKDFQRKTVGKVTFPLQHLCQPGR